MAGGALRKDEKPDLSSTGGKRARSADCDARKAVGQEWHPAPSRYNVQAWGASVSIAFSVRRAGDKSEQGSPAPTGVGLMLSLILFQAVIIAGAIRCASDTTCGLCQLAAWLEG